MRSTSGAHFIALDHVRALAIFMVFVWHFTHTKNGYPVPFEYAPGIFALSILDEGHTGVALFMTLSGYLFAKLLSGKSIHYGAFLWNRILRLLPLLLVVIVINGLITLFNGEDVVGYILYTAKGVLFPSLPNGGWSITVEFHYYAILPLFLWVIRKAELLPLAIVAGALVLRCFLQYEIGDIQSLAYLTIIGRVDQFALGMLVCQFRSRFAHRHVMAGATIVGFMIIYWYFDLHGGFYQTSPSLFWIVLSTIEGIAYAVSIAWYDNSFSHSTTSGVSKLLGRIGEYSYSIYLLHFYAVFHAAKFVHERIMDISNFYLACLWSVVFFLMMMLPGYVSFRFIEGPFMSLRKRYIA